MTTIMKGFLKPGPNGPRMTENQLTFVTKGMLAVSRSPTGQANTMAMRLATHMADGFTVDTSCHTCWHSNLAGTMGAHCNRYDKEIIPSHMEADGCPSHEDGSPRAAKP